METITEAWETETGTRGSQKMAFFSPPSPLPSKLERNKLFLCMLLPQFRNFQFFQEKLSVFISTFSIRHLENYNTHEYIIWTHF